MTRAGTTQTWRNLALLTVALGTLGAVASGCSTATSPATGRTFSTPISEQQEAQLGREEHPKILAEFGGEYKEKPALTAYVSSVGQFIAATSERKDVTYTFTVLNTPDVNAFAVPGGYIVVLRGLLEEMRTAEELAGVLAHEIQHVLRRHSTKALVQHISTGLLLTAVSGDVSGVMAYGLEGARVLGQLSYGRAAEEEADILGMRLVIAAGLDPQGMIAFFEATQKDERRGPGRPVYLSSHPGAADRIARLTRLAQAAPPPRRPALGETEWAALRAICAKPSETR
jgi:predicted Zn-dependent protease